MTEEGVEGGAVSGNFTPKGKESVAQNFRGTGTVYHFKRQTQREFSGNFTITSITLNLLTN